MKREVTLPEDAITERIAEEVEAELYGEPEDRT